MGNKSGKAESPERHSPNPLLTDEEYEILVNAYNLSQRRPSLRLTKKDHFRDSWKHSADDHIVKIYCNYLQQEPDKEMTLEMFTQFFCNFTKVHCREVAQFTITILKHADPPISYDKLVLYITKIISSYFKCLLHLKDKTFEQWKKLGIPNVEEHHVQYARFLCDDLSSRNIEDNYQNWFSLCPPLQKLQSTFIYKLFHVPVPPVTYKQQMFEKHLLPSLLGTENLHKGSSFSVLSMTDVLFLNSVVPEASQFEWELCFSTVLHGLGFGKLVRLIAKKGPTVVVLREKGGHIFGGYASSSWIVGPNFHGTAESFLFKLYPEMQVYESTGYNNHYQYVNLQQQTMPNGLGMGGQFEYFGFWLDADFKGHSSQSCTTYKNYAMLSKMKTFTVDHLEVWAVTNPDKDDLDDVLVDGKSILDKDAGAKALLEIAGKSMASDGYRDKPDGGHC